MAKTKVKKTGTSVPSPPHATSVQYLELLQNLSKISEEEAIIFRKEKNISVDTGDSNGQSAEIFKPVIRFSDSSAVLPKGLLKICDGFEDIPSAIQSQTWPYALTFSKSIVGIAETGSGKTIAFGIPAIAKVIHLSGTKKNVPNGKYSPDVLILAPTRELAIQIGETIEKATGFLEKPIKSTVIYGGVDRSSQLAHLLSTKPQILIATPGRLLDYLSEDELSLFTVSYFVLDEADRMLDMGFAPDVKRIVNAMDSTLSRQTLMFSATWPSTIKRLADSLIKGPSVRISVTSRSELLTSTDNSQFSPSSLKGGSTIKQIVTVVDDHQEKEKILFSLLSKYSSGKIILFVLYKKEADRIEQVLLKKGYKVSTIHGDKAQSARASALATFKDGKSLILLATDVASRGLDIPFVETVINYTFPLTIEDYVHRIGRTGRAGRSGVAHTIFSPLDKNHSGELIGVLRNSGQDVPQELLAFGTATKKREHKDYGSHYKEIDPSIKPKHFKFDD
ncbi:RNA-dependent ATPase [Mitosporidium daphniae]|uniref:RNA helicase n=1 Tax=Mitosporidium daphniae TaxID=1485682 RepID=A0A098VPP5_9MICR|nr:uncharacterized protein DI09_50p170 [Mitosporidium daphniae]XP_013239459.1 uncharacterized protein DI09_117p80 [Mitosporidium daphniae]KGG50910.1 hypothetical protein DI09_50p170 [Mitosporidium daphniae]KGG53023.1 hypothetical protein DI09_117p80 [Mitosporidium daphniae]|eukprot:XP_013237337.1 uncharacterized protein DI09_50p170 [Mitosporidium daphniae]